MTLFGPTNFGEFLGVASQIAQQYDQTGGKQFLILLIVTDGEITDMQPTIDRIVQGCFSFFLSLFLLTFSLFSIWLATFDHHSWSG